MTFAQAAEAGLSIDEIDARYKDALHSEAELGLFNTASDAFIAAYRDFLTRHAQYLNQNGFFWEQQTRIFSRIYFSREGSVDYFLINEQQAGLSREELTQFLDLTLSFLGENGIGIHGEVPFAQCSPVVYGNVRTSSESQ